MSSPDAARRAKAEIAFDGVDISSSIAPYLTLLEYKDCEEGETDDLKITLQDRDGAWLSGWLGEALDAAAGEALRIDAAIAALNRRGDGKDEILDCGQFELDSVSWQEPPSTVTLRATSLPYTGSIRQVEKTRAWEAYTLRKIAAQIAAENGMTCMYESAEDPYYDRVEQYKQSDTAFLTTLCGSAGISFKATGGIIVLFDQAAYEAKPAVLRISRRDGSYTRANLSVNTADTSYKSCRVRYTDPATGECIEGIAESGEKGGSQRLEITAKVSSAGEAKELAAKLLRAHNKFAKTAVFDMPGNPKALAGVTVELEKFGPWSGKYIISRAEHTLSSSGYTTKMTLRRVLEGY